MIRTYRYGEVDNKEIFAKMDPGQDVSAIVRDIIENVINNGDKALKEYSLKFDKAELEQLQVSGDEIREAFESITPELLEVLKEAADNIRQFHSRQVRTGFMMDKDGIIMGQKILPIEKAGVYVPGGTAAYPSTVLMNTIPASIAGCSEIVMVTPPGKDGKIKPALLVAATLGGATKIFKTGGAQAVAALAYGTESIPKVDKIVGPGNVFVAEAKRQVFGLVSIDMIAGPSEILIVADGSSDPELVAADMLSQAEHDKNASAVLVTDSAVLAEAVTGELERQLKELEREEIARVSVDVNGKIIVCDDIALAIDIANEIAPEHLELCLDDPFRYLGAVKNAGSIFLGRSCPEAVGDYFAGVNHTLPTSGTARFSSPLSVDDFIKKTQYTYYSEEALAKAAEKIDLFARTEGLTGHGKSVTKRMK